MFSVARAADITGGKSMHSSVFDRRESILLVKQPLVVGPPLRAFELFGALAACIVESSTYKFGPESLRLKSPVNKSSCASIAELTIGNL